MNGRHFFWLFALLAVSAIAGTATYRTWQQQERTALARAALPELPALMRWPGEMVAAVVEATNAVKAAKEPVAPLGRLAGIYLINGFAAEAQRTLAGLRRLDPANARWAYLEAEWSRQRGDPRGAEEKLEATLALDSTYAPAWLRLGELCLARQAYERADACFQHATIEAPGNVRAIHAAVSFEARHARRTDQRQKLSRLAQDHPGIEEVHALLAELHAAGGESALAEKQRRLAAKATRRISTEDPWLDALLPACFDPRRLILLARRLAAEGRSETAEELLTRAVRLARKESAPRRELAEFYEHAQRLNEARDAWDAAVAACPDEPALVAGQARARRREHKPQEAAAIVRRALERWPERVDLHLELGLALRDGRMTDEAVAVFRRTLELNPVLPEARYNLGFCLLALGQRDEARAALEAALTVRPDYPEALLVLGGLALDDDDIEMAERHATRLRELAPEEPGLQTLFGALHLEKGNRAQADGQLAAADQIYRMGLEIAPEFPPLLHAAASLSARRADYERVTALWERYLQVQPRDLDAYLPLVEAYRELQQGRQMERILERGIEMATKLGNEPKRVEFQARLDALP